MLVEDEQATKMHQDARHAGSQAAQCAANAVLGEHTYLIDYFKSMGVVEPGKRYSPAELVEFLTRRQDNRFRVLDEVRMELVG